MREILINCCKLPISQRLRRIRTPNCEKRYSAALHSKELRPKKALKSQSAAYPLRYLFLTTSGVR